MLCVLSSLVRAGVPQDSISQETDMDQVVVTATRTQKLLKDVPILTRVISSEEIQKLDATNIEDLLQQEMPGVEFSYAMNQQTHFNFAGFGGQSVLFLVDGERLAGETMDDVDFSRLSMANVERIEIIKGAASALYGSNATGGVINIITKSAVTLKDGKESDWNLNVNGRYGTHNNQRYGLLFGLGGKHLQNTFNFARTSIDSYDVTNGDKQKAATLFMVDRYYGDQTWNFSDRLTWKVRRNLSFSANAGYYFRGMETKKTNSPDHYRDYTFGVKGVWDITGKDHLEIRYNYDQYDKAQHNTLTDRCVRNYSNVQNSVNAVYTREFGSKGFQGVSGSSKGSNGSMLTVGGDYLYDFMLNNKTRDGKHNQKSFDLFAQYDWNVTERLELVGALRYDYFSEGSVNRVTPKFNLRWTPFAGKHSSLTSNLSSLTSKLSSLTFRVGYGVGFRAPTLKEKYYIFNMSSIWDVVGSNVTGQNLVPEVSHNINLSVDWLYMGWNVVVSAYYNNIRNRITTGAPQDISTFPGDKSLLGTTRWLSYINVPEYDAFGLDMAVEKRWKISQHSALNFRLQYTYVHEQLPRDNNGEAINNQYQMARPHSFNVRIDWDHQFTSNYGLDIVLNGRVMSGVDNVEFVDYTSVDPTTGHLARTNVHYPAYTLWKLLLTQRIYKAFKLTFTVDNLFNYNPTYHYFNSPFTNGISFLGGLSIDVDEIFRLKCRR